MKKLLALILLLLVSFTAAACDLEGRPTPEPEMTDQEKVDFVAGRMAALFPDRYTTVLSVDLDMDWAYDVTVTWESTHPDILSPTGVVNRPVYEDGDTTVILTAIITLNAAEAEADVTFVVLKLPEGIPADVMTIEDAIAVDSGDFVRIEGIVILHVPRNNGFYMYDETGFMYVRDTNWISSTGDRPYEVGEVIQIVGARGTFRGVEQITNIQAHRISESTFTPEGNIGLVDIADIIAGVYPAGTLVTVRGTVDVIVGQFTDYRMYDGTDFIQIDHNSDNSEFLEFDEMYVEAEVTVHQWNHTTPFVVFFGEEEDITPITLSDEDMLQLAWNALTLGDTTTVIDDLDLPLVGLYDVQISWQSSDETVVENDGTVHRWPDDETVTLTATLTLGDEDPLPKEFTVTVMNELYGAEGMSVADALLEADDETVLVEGVVSSYSAFGGQLFIQDPDGTAIYVNANLAADVQVGDKIIVQGVLDTYDSWGNNQRRLNSPTIITNLEGDHEIFIITGKTYQDIFNEYPANSSQRFFVDSPGEIVNIQYGQFFIETGESNYVTFNYADYGTYFFDAGYAVGDYLPPMTFTVANIHFGALRVYGVIFDFEPTPDEIEDHAIAEFNIPAEVTNDLTLPDFLEFAGIDYLEVFGYTVIWDASLHPAITNEGVVTRPDFGDGNEMAIITAIIDTPAETTISHDFTVTVLEMPDPDAVADPVTVTAVYPDGSGTTNMTDGNNAASLELDPLVFDVESTKRVLSPLHIGLNNAGQIRLYGSADTQGNILTISIHGDYKITDIEFVFGSVVGNAVIITGATTQFDGALTASGTLTYSDLDVSSFSIQNTNESTGQIYILEIHITYEPVE